MDPEAPHVATRRRRKRRRRGTPRLVLLCIVLCAAAVAVVPLGHSRGWWGRVAEQPPAASKATVGGQAVSEADLNAPAALLLSEAYAEGDGPSRRLAGTIENTSGSRYDDIQVSFLVRGPAGELLGTVVAKLPTIAPRSTAGFQTGPLPERAVRHSLRDLSGTRR